MYKTIVVHVDQTVHCSRRTEAAARLAVQFGAHLTGAAMTGLQPYMMPMIDYETGLGALGIPLAQLRAEAAAALDSFERLARAAGAAAIECRCIDDEPAIGISLQARYGDLVVIGQSEPGEFLPRLRSDFPDYVVLNSPRPVLVIPSSGACATLGQRVTVGWNGSAEAARAIASAIPLLQGAAQVDLVVFDAAAEDGLHGDEPGADMALYLARHGVPTEVHARAAALPGGQSLLAFALERSADLIVMGAYGHSRFRETLLGGMTRDLLAASTIPLWMAH